MPTTSILAPPMPQSLPIPNRLSTVLVCAATGLLGGLALMPAAHATMVTGPVLGVLYGLLFALLVLESRNQHGLRAALGPRVMHCYCGSRWSR